MMLEHSQYLLSSRILNIDLTIRQLDPNLDNFANLLLECLFITKQLLKKLKRIMTNSGTVKENFK